MIDECLGKWLMNMTHEQGGEKKNVCELIQREKIRWWDVGFSVHRNCFHISWSQRLHDIGFKNIFFLYSWVLIWCKNTNVCKIKLIFLFNNKLFQHMRALVLWSWGLVVKHLSCLLVKKMQSHYWRKWN